MATYTELERREMCIRVTPEDAFTPRDPFADERYRLVRAYPGLMCDPCMPIASMRTSIEMNSGSAWLRQLPAGRMLPLPGGAKPEPPPAAAPPPPRSPAPATPEQRRAEAEAYERLRLAACPELNANQRWLVLNGEIELARFIPQEAMRTANAAAAKRGQEGPYGTEHFRALEAP